LIARTSVPFMNPMVTCGDPTAPTVILMSIGFADDLVQGDQRLLERHATTLAPRAADLGRASSRTVRGAKPRRSRLDESGRYGRGDGPAH
jgi:hypothetical protein